MNINELKQGDKIYDIDWRSVVHYTYFCVHPNNSRYHILINATQDPVRIFEDKLIAILSQEFKSYDEALDVLSDRLLEHSTKIKQELSDKNGIINITEKPKESLNTFIVRTSNLGYDFQIDKVFTDMNLSQLQSIDNKYGMQTRSQSTSIKQLQDGAVKEGYVFEYETLYKMNNDFEKILSFKVDYNANYGNY